MPAPVDVDVYDDDEYNLESFVTEDFQSSTMDDIQNSPPGTSGDFATGHLLGDTIVSCDQRSAVRMHFIS